MADEKNDKPKPEESLTPLLDSVTDPEAETDDTPAAIEEKGEPDGGGNFA